MDRGLLYFIFNIKSSHDRVESCVCQGLPETVVTDNGTCFTSSEFEGFLKKNGIKHFTSAPYHPASNGLAERAVQIVKKGLKKMTEGSISERLARILMSYRLTPQTTTGISPAELLLGKRPRSRLDLLKPHTAEHVEISKGNRRHNMMLSLRTGNWRMVRKCLYTTTMVYQVVTRCD